MPLAGRIALLLLAVLFYIGVGVALVHLRLHHRAHGTVDPIVLAAALTLAAFGALTTTAAAGVAAVPAVGVVVIGAAYVASAQRTGLFRIERVPPRRIVRAKPRSHR